MYEIKPYGNHVVVIKNNEIVCHCDNDKEAQEEIEEMEETNVKMEELIKIKIYSMDETIYFVEIPYQIYEKDMVDIWISQNLRNVDYWEYWK